MVFLIFLKNNEKNSSIHLTLKVYFRTIYFFITVIRRIIKKLLL